MTTASRFMILGAAIALSLVTLRAGNADPRRHVAVVRPAASLRFGKSVGSPTEGKLMGGAHLEEAPYLRILPSHAAGDVRWGVAPLVQAIDRAARTVRAKYPEAVASVGHLSRPGGGEIDRHRSHESGRDADIAFYAHNRKGKTLIPDALTQFGEGGAATHWKGAFFDEAKTWTFIQSLVSDPQARVTHIFIASHLRRRLLEYAEKAGAPAGARIRAASVMMQPTGSLPHDDHFHVRVSCPGGQKGCVERPAAPKRAKHRKKPGRRRGAPAHFEAKRKDVHAHPKSMAEETDEYNTKQIVQEVDDDAPAAALTKVEGD